MGGLQWLFSIYLEDTVFNMAWRSRSNQAFKDSDIAVIHNDIKIYTITNLLTLQRYGMAMITVVIHVHYDVEVCA